MKTKTYFVLSGCASVCSMLTATAAVLLSACTTAPPTQALPKPLPLVAQTQTVNIPPDLLVDCQPLSKLDTTKTYNQGDSIDVVSTWSAEHLDCSIRFKKLRDLTAKAFNINIDAQGNVIPAAPSASVAN